MRSDSQGKLLQPSGTGQMLAIFSLPTCAAVVNLTGSVCSRGSLQAFFNPCWVGYGDANSKLIH